MKLSVNEIICDHNIRAMRKFPDNSIHSIITDPPYGLGFMGKDWDTFNPEDLEKVKRQQFERLKIHPRTDGRKVPRDYKSHSAGSYDFSRNKEFQKWFTRWAKECLRVAKPGAFMFVFGGTRTFHRLTCAIEDAGWQIRDCLMWLYGSGFPKSLDISKAIDKATGAERKIVGKGTSGKTETHKSNYQMSYQKDNTFGGEFNITAPTCELAKLWDGYGTGLKPSWEPIIIAMKPVDGNFAKNAEKWGVAGLNIDGGRIGVDEMPAQRRGNAVNTDFMSGGITFEHQGRFPANVILDEQAAAMLDLQSGVSMSKASGYNFELGNQNNPSKIVTNIKSGIHFADSGGASRFFYIAKASKGERNAGCGDLEEKTAAEITGRKEGSAGLKCGLAKMSGVYKNFHPTVKPLSLMKYLCMLLKMPNRDQIILDPFVGSGTTCIACKELGINYIGIDKDEDYCKIARARLKNVRLTLFEKPVRKIKKKKKVRRRLL